DSSEHTRHPEHAETHATERCRERGDSTRGEQTSETPAPVAISCADVRSGCRSNNDCEHRAERRCVVEAALHFELVEQEPGHERNRASFQARSDDFETATAAPT